MPTCLVKVGVILKMNSLNINTLTDEIRKNMNGREMPFSYSYTSEKGIEEYEVYKIAIPR